VTGIVRYRGEITVSTLWNWRALRIGPGFVKTWKIGKAILYPLDELDAWVRKNFVTCRVVKWQPVNDDDRT
jgi:hypothetical protein